MFGQMNSTHKPLCSAKIRNWRAGSMGELLLFFSCSGDDDNDEEHDEGDEEDDDNSNNDSWSLLYHYLFSIWWEWWERRQAGGWLWSSTNKMTSPIIVQGAVVPEIRFSRCISKQLLRPRSTILNGFRGQGIRKRKRSQQAFQGREIMDFQMH